MDELDDCAAKELLGCAVVLEVCARILAGRPNLESVAELRRVAALVDAADPERCAAACEDGEKIDSAALAQRFDQRFFVTSSPLYIPLSENCIRQRRVVGGQVAYGPVEGADSVHVAACYEAAGFNWRAALGAGLLAHAARPDALAAELLFAAWIARSCAEAAACGDEQQARHAGALAKLFCDQHLSRWAADAAELLAATDEDLFSQAATLAVRAVEALEEAIACMEREL